MPTRRRRHKPHADGCANAGARGIAHVHQRHDDHARRAVVEQIGRRGSERVVQKSYGDLRVCRSLTASTASLMTGESGPFRSDRVISRRDVQRRAHLRRQHGRVTYTVNGAVQRSTAPHGSGATISLVLDPPGSRALRARELAARRISSIKASGVRGRSDLVVPRPGRSMNGEISSLRGHVSSMQGQISAIRAMELTARRDLVGARRDLHPARHELGECPWHRRDGRIRRQRTTFSVSSVRSRDYYARPACARLSVASTRSTSRPRSPQCSVDPRLRRRGKVARPRRLLDGLGADDRVNRIEDEIRAMDDPAQPGARGAPGQRGKLKRTLRFSRMSSTVVWKKIHPNPLKETIVSNA